MVADQENLYRVLQRILSALVLAPLVILIIWAGGWWLVGLIAFAVVIGIHEMTALFKAGGFHPRFLVAALMGLGFVAAEVFQAQVSVNLIGVVLGMGTLLALVIAVVLPDRTGALGAWAVTLASAVYVGMLLTYFLSLRTLVTPLQDSPLAALGLDSGAAWVYAVVAVTWASDTGAYFAGRAFGRRKMSPLLSPKKTWEGLAGGVLAAVAAGVLIVLLVGLPIGLAGGIIIGVLGALGGTFGDLAESLLKRQAGIKDSGKLIPGHGGLLDRIDSLLFTGPLIYYLAVVLT